MSDKTTTTTGPPPVEKPTEPEAPKDTGGSGKQRAEHLDGVDAVGVNAFYL